jgi:hypothetical protein
MGNGIERKIVRIFWGIAAAFAAFAVFDAYRSREGDLAAIRLGCERETVFGVPAFDCGCVVNNFRSENSIWQYIPIFGANGSLSNEQFQARYRNLVLRCARP